MRQVKKERVFKRENGREMEEYKDRKRESWRNTDKERDGGIEREKEAETEE